VLDAKVLKDAKVLTDEVAPRTPSRGTRGIRRIRRNVPGGAHVVVAHSSAHSQDGCCASRTRTNVLVDCDIDPWHDRSERGRGCRSAQVVALPAGPSSASIAGRAPAHTTVHGRVDGPTARALMGPAATEPAATELRAALAKPPVRRRTGTGSRFDRARECRSHQALLRSHAPFASPGCLHRPLPGRVSTRHSPVMPSPATLAAHPDTGCTTPISAGASRGHLPALELGG